MRARDLAEPYPIVRTTDNALAAARTMGDRQLLGLIVLGDDGRPWTVLPGSQVLNFLIPPYVQDDPALARVYEEDWHTRAADVLGSRTVRDVLPPKKDLARLPVVDADATTMEIAALMARVHSPVVAVVDGDEVLGAVTVRVVLGHLIPSGDGSA